MEPSRSPRSAPGVAGAPRRPLRLLVVDPFAPVREGLRALIAEEADLAVVGEAADGQGAVALARSLRPDVVLLETALPAGDGIATVGRLRAVDPQLRVLVLTGVASGPEVRRAVAAGASGYLLKDALWGGLLGAIRDAAPAPAPA